MQDIQPKLTWKDFKTRKPTERIILVKKYVFDKIIPAHPYIAFILWGVLAYLFHCNIHKIEKSDALPIVGIVAAVAALSIAQNQLTSWKQEKLLERLETMLLAAITLRSLLNNLESRAPLSSFGILKTRDFQDSDLDVGIETYSNGLIDRHSITETSHKIRHQLIFAQKLIGKYSFHINKMKDVNEFFSATNHHLYSLDALLTTFEHLHQQQNNPIAYTIMPGFKSKQLEDHYATWVRLQNNVSETEQALWGIAPPSFHIENTTRALINTLRV